MRKLRSLVQSLTPGAYTADMARRPKCLQSFGGGDKVALETAAGGMPAMILQQLDTRL